MQPRDTASQVQTTLMSNANEPSVDSKQVPEAVSKDQMVSFYAELPSDLQVAMRSFIERYPNWDQYRLVKAALAGFLVQNGCNSRPITRLYVGNMFSSESLAQGI